MIDFFIFNFIFSYFSYLFSTYLYTYSYLSVIYNLYDYDSSHIPTTKSAFKSLRDKAGLRDKASSGSSEGVSVIQG